MKLLIISIFLTLFATITIRNIFWGLTLIIFLLPTYLIRFKISFIPFTFLEGMILVLGIIWFFQKLKNNTLKKSFNKINSKLQNIKWPILMLLFAAIISVFISPNKLSALGDLRAFFVEPLILFIIFLDLVKTEKEIKNIFLALGGSAIYIALFTIFQIFTGFFVPENYLKEGRMTAFYQYPAAVGLFLAPLLAMFLGFLIEKIKIIFEKQKAKNDHLNWEKNFIIFVITTILLASLALVATKTEGAYLGVIVATFLMLVFTPWRKWIIFGAFLLSIILFAFPPSRHYLIQKITLSDVSGDVRKVLWQGTWKAIKAHPIFGGGLSGFPQLYQQYKEKKHTELLKYPHNIIFNFWTETGILGIFSFLWLIFIFFKNTLKKYPSFSHREILSGVIAAMIALFVYGLLDVPYFKNDLSILFWIIVGLSLI